MSSLARTLIAIGMACLVLGLVVHAFPTLPLGRLPGDIRIERPGLRIYLPIASCLVVSAVLSAVFWLLSRWR
jgi:Protein of unknown function (DUF2905)